MAILTKFLQLLKPEKNDYVDVEKHLSENYDKIDTKMEELSNSNDKKLNKGAVSTEYDTAKKIEDKIKEAQSTADNKLDKGNVLEKYNTAEKIGKEIDLKQNKIDNGLITIDKNIVEAINESTWHFNSKNLDNIISSNTKLSDIKEEGIFNMHSNVDYITDLPIDRPFSLLNRYFLGEQESGRYLFQILHCANYQGTYKREIGWDGIASDWSKILEHKDIVDNKLEHIQDNITKYRGKSYLDALTGKIYMCIPADKIDSIQDTSVTSNFSLLTITDNRNRIEYLSERIVTGECKASTPNSANGDKLQFDRKILSVSAMHNGWDPSVCVVCDDREKNTNFELGKVTFTANYPSQVSVIYIIILGDKL